MAACSCCDSAICWACFSEATAGSTRVAAQPAMIETAAAASARRLTARSLLPDSGVVADGRISLALARLGRCRENIGIRLMKWVQASNPRAIVAALGLLFGVGPEGAAGVSSAGV